MKLPCKKRYIVGVLAIVFVLYACSDGDDDYARVKHYQVDSEGYQAPLQQPAPVVVQQPPQQVVVEHDSDNGFFNGMMMAHMLHHTTQPRQVVNRTTIVKNYKVTRNKSYYGTRSKSYGRRH